MKLKMTKLAGDNNKGVHIPNHTWFYGFSWTPRLGEPYALSEICGMCEWADGWEGDIYLPIVEKMVITGWGFIIKANKEVWSLKIIQNDSQSSEDSRA